MWVFSFFYWWVCLKVYPFCLSLWRISFNFIDLFCCFFHLRFFYFCSDLVVSFLLLAYSFVFSFCSCFRCNIRLFIWDFSYFLRYLVSSSWVTHPAGISFYFIEVCPLLPSRCGFFFVFGCRIYLLVSSSLCIVVDGCSAVSCDFGVSVRRHEFISCLCPKTILLFTRGDKKWEKPLAAIFIRILRTMTWGIQEELIDV